MAEGLLQPEDDTILSLFGSPYRRRILRCLESAPEGMTANDLAREVTTETQRAESVAQVSATLRHTHLPKLADRNAIRYDAESGRASITAHGEKLVGCLDAIEGWRRQRETSPE
ncbi:MAG: DUF7344 domain-containing protein [Halobacteriota archaeon]